MRLRHAPRTIPGRSVPGPAVRWPADLGEQTQSKDEDGPTMNTLDALDAQSLRSDIPDFRPGDRLKVHVRVIEGSRERTQVFEGVVIRRQGDGVRETFTVRKISFAVGVERTFPVHSPNIARIERVSRGDVRRAKLYYLRELRGKAAKIKEKRDTPTPSCQPANLLSRNLARRLATGRGEGVQPPGYQTRTAMTAS